MVPLGDVSTVVAIKCALGFEKDISPELRLSTNVSNDSGSWRRKSYMGW